MNICTYTYTKQPTTITTPCSVPRRMTCLVHVSLGTGHAYRNVGISLLFLGLDGRIAWGCSVTTQSSVHLHPSYITERRFSPKNCRTSFSRDMVKGGGPWMELFHSDAWAYRVPTLPFALGACFLCNPYLMPWFCHHVSFCFLTFQVPPDMLPITLCVFMSNLFKLLPSSIFHVMVHSLANKSPLHCHNKRCNIQGYNQFSVDPSHWWDHNQRPAL
mmetsp:Transcript_30125/g.69525  ORF Transcript_30125/g.69525 Transcript_30125/m.69525 type:complete len:216 (+) Transcript_30125:1-648(+)